MDIIDIMLAKAMTPQGKTEAYVAKANKAAQQAAAAEANAAAAIATVEAAADDIATTQATATQLLEDAQEALETAQAAQINTLDTEDVDAEIKKLNVNTAVVDGTAAKTIQVITTYPDNTLNTQNVTKLYKSQGDNEDGTMTQKAIKAYVDSSVANVPSSSGNINFNVNEAGQIVVINEQGHIIASNIKEEELINLLLQNNIYNAKDSVGLDIHYANKSFARTQGAIGLTAGNDFNQFIMYGGRMRCNVADDGTITAFYGDPSYTEDGTNGQVMVYQPKFYYQRIPLSLESSSNGSIIRHESLILSASKQTGFKLAPIFQAGDEELDYVLLSAYEGAVIDGKLTSIANTKPSSNLTVADAEQKASLRGSGWHIANMASISANQMLEIVEFGSMNGQASLEAGICNITGASNKNCSSITGSTSILGNATGHATSTINEINGNTTTETVAGKRAISYRGIENPWGNIWHMIGDMNIEGGNATQGGIPYICTDFNYTPGIIGSNYESIGFYLPAQYSWISAMGYGNSKYDWIFLPIECASANSALPIGDNLWTMANTDGTRILAVGGSYNLQEDVGPFYYAADRSVSESSRNNYGARLIFVPTKNTIYSTNIINWTAKAGV